MSIRDNLGGGTVLDSLEEIAANTEPGKQAGALAVKELNDSLGGLKFGTDGEGNFGYFGADGSLIPFKGNKTKIDGKTKYTATSNCDVIVVTVAYDQDGDKPPVLIYKNDVLLVEGVDIPSTDIVRQKLTYSNNNVYLGIVTTTIKLNIGDTLYSSNNFAYFYV